MDYYFFNPEQGIPPLTSIGSKGYNLCRMLEAGIRVPPFFIITAETLQRWQPGEKGQMTLSEKELSELYLAVDSLVDDGGHVSVRSSASIEDGSSFSFAGQFYTELFVDNSNLLSAIQKCYASASGAGIDAYMQVNRINATGFPFAIIVQRMVHATRSGVGFSMRPGGNLATMCMVAGYGAGEGVVMEKVETDTYLLNRRNRELQKTIVTKTERFAFDGHARLLEVGPELSNLPVLSDTEIQELGDLLLKTEKLLGSPSDIEFSLDENGDLYLLQMRPITSIEPDEIKILDNTNIIESYPGITLPLSFDFARQAYEKLFRSSAAAFWVSKNDSARLEEAFKHLIAHVEGRIYYRLDNWYRMLALVHRSKKSLRDWENAVGLRDSEMDQIIKGFRGKLRAYSSSIWLILTFRRGNRSFYRNFDRAYKKLRNSASCRGDVSNLWEHYERHTSSLFSFWHHTIVNDFLAFQSFSRVQALLHNARVPELANDLVAGKSGVESEEAIIEVLRLKGQIQSDEGLTLLFKEEDIQVLDSLKIGEFPAFASGFFSYLDRYGDRTLAELKLETPSPRSFPLLMVRMLKQQLQSEVSADGFLQKKRSILEQAAKTKREKFPWWSWRRLVLEFNLRLACYGLKNRENMRFCRTRAYGAVKDIFMEIGSAMEKEGKIQHEHDIFYLHLEEVKVCCRNMEKGNFYESIKKRKALLSQAENMQLPDRIMYCDELPDFGNTDIEPSISGDDMHGIGVSPGKIMAEGLVVVNPTFDLEVKKRVLVSKMTDPGWVFLMAQASALVSEKGSLLSHTAIVGRELGIPVVVNVPGATQRIKSGDMLTVDGRKGSVLVMNKNDLKKEANESN